MRWTICKFCIERNQTGSSLLYAPVLQTNSLQYGLATGVTVHKTLKNLSVQLFGSSIDSKIPCLAASPGILNFYI